MNKLVSIIIPVYNAEKFLDRCLKSIINQTYKNIEIILVNDGSKDNSRKICEKYSSKDSRIKIINQENSGPAFTRNRGLDAAKGDYICFVDADDYVDLKYVETLLNAIISTKSDVVECGYYYVTPDKTKEVHMKPYTGIKKYDISKAFVEKVYFNNYPWNKMYSKKVLKDLKFLNLRQSEDHELLSRIYLRSNKKTNIDDLLYYYITNDNSICGQAFSIKRMDVIHSEEKVFENYNNAGYNDIANYIAYRLIGFVIEFYDYANQLDKETRDKIHKELKEKFKKYKKYALKSNTRTGGQKLSIKGKLVRWGSFVMFSVFPNKTSKLLYKRKK